MMEITNQGTVNGRQEKNRAIIEEFLVNLYIVAYHFIKQKKEWAVQLRVDGRPKWIGWFKNELDAAKAYNEAVKEHLGDNYSHILNKIDKE